MATKKTTTTKATTTKKTTKEEKTMATAKKTTTKATTAKTAKATEPKTATKAKTTTKATTAKKTATAKAEPKTVKKATSTKTATTKATETPKRTATKKSAPKSYVTITKLNNMKGGDRIAPKNNKDNWFMKIPSGVYEGRFESHASGEVFTAERVYEMLADIDCTVTKRKALMLESFYDKKEDLYVIPNKWMTECWIEVMEKLEKGKDKDGFRFCLFADKDEYTLVELELDF